MELLSRAALASTIAKTTTIWPHRILVADIVTKDQGATAAINKSRIWRGVSGGGYGV
jgi:hypothetical protein